MISCILDFFKNILNLETITNVSAKLLTYLKDDLIQMFHHNDLN